MYHNILLTGTSGYLGGDLLARWRDAKLPAYNKLYALVRLPSQAEAVEKYGAEALIFDVYDEEEVRRAVVDNGISVVYHLIGTQPDISPSNFLKALAEVKSNTGRDVHFLHTSGAKMFSSHASFPSDEPILDTDPRLYEIQKKLKPSIPLAQAAVGVNNFVIEESAKLGVRSYIFVPCVVYGESLSSGNKISIQTVAIVRAADALKRVYRVSDNKPTWPVCYIADNTSLYLELMRKILAGVKPSHGKNGYYLAASGNVAWDDLYAAMATALAKRNIVKDDTVTMADEETLKAMGEALGCPAELVPVQMSGSCTLTADRASDELGWKPLYGPEHILENADAEVELILRHKKW